MAEDRLHKDYDNVENLSDLIKAREERESAFTDSVDAMQDADLQHMPVDAVDELTWPHPADPEEDRLGLDVELMDTPEDKEVEFDWQDSAEEMLDTDPPADEGMGYDGEIEALAHVDPNDLAGPVPSVEVGEETGTDSTREEREEYELDGGEETGCPPSAPVPLDSAMDTDSDEYDFSIDDKFAGQMDEGTALEDFRELEQAIDEEHRQPGPEE